MTRNGPPLARHAVLSWILSQQVLMGCDRVDVAGVLTEDAGRTSSTLPSESESERPDIAEQILMEPGDADSCALARGGFLHYQVLAPLDDGSPQAEPEPAEWYVDNRCRYWVRLGMPPDPILHGALSAGDVAQLRDDFAPNRWPEDAPNQVRMAVPVGRVLLTDGVQRIIFGRDAPDPDLPEEALQLVEQAAAWAQRLNAAGGLRLD